MWGVGCGERWLGQGHLCGACVQEQGVRCAGHRAWSHSGCKGGPPPCTLDGSERGRWRRSLEPLSEGLTGAEARVPDGTLTQGVDGQEQRKVARCLGQ